MGGQCPRCGRSISATTRKQDAAHVVAHRLDGGVGAVDELGVLGLGQLHGEEVGSVLGRWFERASAAAPGRAGHDWITVKGRT